MTITDFVWQSQLNHNRTNQGHVKWVVHRRERESCIMHIYLSSSMGRGWYRTYSSRVDFTSRQRHRRITVNKWYTPTFIRHYGRRTTTGCRTRRIGLPRMEWQRECWRRRYNSAWRGSWSWRWTQISGTLSHLHCILFRGFACFQSAIVEGEVEESRAWWVPL